MPGACLSTLTWAGAFDVVGDGDVAAGAAKIPIESSGG
jgi:hypothetical protein